MDAFDDDALCNVIESSGEMDKVRAPASTDGVSSLSDTISKFLVKVVPNPANNSATVIYSGGGSGEYKVELFDNLGSLTLAKADLLNTGKISLDLSSLDTGVYIVQLSKNGNAVLHTKFIIAHQ
jgi:hypothetical protein